MIFYKQLTKNNLETKLIIDISKNFGKFNSEKTIEVNFKIEPISLCENFFEFFRSGTELLPITNTQRTKNFYYFSIFIFLFLTKHGFILEAKLFIFKVCGEFLDSSYYTIFLKNSRKLNQGSISEFLERKVNFTPNFPEIIKNFTYYTIHKRFKINSFITMNSKLKGKMKNRATIESLHWKEIEKISQKIEKKNCKNNYRSFLPSKYITNPRKSCYLKILKIRCKNATLINCLDLSKNQRTLTIGYQNSMIQVFDFLKPKPNEGLYLLKGNRSSIICAKKMNIAKYILNSSLGGELYLWSLEQRSVVSKYVIPKQTIWDFSFTQNENSFVSAGSLGYAAYWHIERFFPIRLFIGHTSDINVVKIHSDSNFIGTGSDDNTVRLWDIRIKKSIGKLFVGCSVNTMDFSSNGDKLTIAGRSRIINTFDLRTLKNFFKIKEGIVKNKIDKLLYMNNESFVYVKDMNILKIWNNQNFKMERSDTIKSFRNFSPMKVVPNLDKIFQININNNNKKLTVLGLNK